MVIRRYRTIRSGRGDYAARTYFTKAGRDRAAQRYADLDQDVVMIEHWSELTLFNADPCNEGWSCHGIKEPRASVAS